MLFSTKPFSLVLDIGTTGIKALVFDEGRRVVSKSYRAIGKNISHDGAWVEQDPVEMVALSIEVLREAAGQADISLLNCAGLGITNQRETVIVWDKTTGKPVYPAIVWEDKRTARRSQEVADSIGDMIREKTGLSTDTYFSASKIEWILKNADISSPDDLLAGTVDTWVLWNLSAQKIHLTDHSNASRTLLFDIKNKNWSDELCQVWGIPRSLLPAALNSFAHYGDLNESILGFSLPVVAVCGDQQASLYAAKKSGSDTKITCGTGTFLLQLEGSELVSAPDFFTTLTPGLAGTEYAVEAKIGAFGQRIEALLKAEKPLDPVVEEIAELCALALEKLPQRPTMVIIDGGITQAPRLLEIFTKASPDIIFKIQEPFDGTALGIADMVFDAGKGIV